MFLTPSCFVDDSLTTDSESNPHNWAPVKVKSRNIAIPSPSRITTLPTKSIFMLVTSLLMSLTNPKPTSHRKKVTISHLGSVIDTKDTCHHHPTQLLSLTHKYLFHKRGRLLLRMLNTTPFLILNGRFEIDNAPIPYTLQRQDEATIHDHNIIAKQHFSQVLLDPVQAPLPVLQ